MGCDIYSCKDTPPSMVSVIGEELLSRLRKTMHLMSLQLVFGKMEPLLVTFCKSWQKSAGISSTGVQTKAIGTAYMQELIQRGWGHPRISHGFHCNMK